MTSAAPALTPVERTLLGLIALAGAAALSLLGLWWLAALPLIAYGGWLLARWKAVPIWALVVLVVVIAGDPDVDRGWLLLIGFGLAVALAVGTLYARRHNGPLGG